MYELDQETVLVHIDDIVIGRNITNIRTHFIEARIKELAQSIYEDGLLQAVVIMDTVDPDDDDDEFTELVAGARRLRAIRYILENMDDQWSCDTGVNPTPGMVKASQFNGDLEDAAILNGVENIEREEVDDVDIAAWLFRMVDSGWIQSDLAKKLHKSGPWVSTRITIHRKGSDKLKAAMRKDYLKSADNPQGGALVALSTAYELAKNLSKEDQDKAIEEAMKGRDKLITLEEAERIADPNKTQRPSKKKRETIRAKAEDLANDPTRPNARGVAMALRWIEGLLSDDEIEEIIEWKVEPPKTPEALESDSSATVDDTDEDVDE